MPFSLELHHLTIENIVELVGSILTDGHSSSDEGSESIEKLPILHKTNINDKTISIRKSLQSEVLTTLF